MVNIDLDGLLGSVQSRRWHHASTVKDLDNVEIPYPLEVWNYDPCDKHETPRADCTWHKCGGKPYKHQNKTAAFSYMAKKSLVGNSTGTGKQQPVSEPVLTPHGWTPIGKLKPGDFVIGSNGRPTKVLEVHPQTERRTFMVCFSDNSWTLTGPEHLWSASRDGSTYETVTTEFIMDNLGLTWTIPLVAPVADVYGSIPERIAFLQDFFDGSGMPNPEGGVSYACVSLEALNRVVSTVQSIGGVCHVTSTSDGLFEGIAYLDPSIKVFSDPHLDSMYFVNKNDIKREFTSIRQVDDSDSVCISVEAEDHLYVTRNYIVTHNTISALLSLALTRHYGEEVKALIVVPTISVKQWHAEAERWTPGFKVSSIPSKVPKRDRLETYASNWDILIMGNHSFYRDVASIDNIGVKQVVVDDIDPALNVNNSTFRALELICRKADMVIDMNATSLQTHLLQLYAASCLIGGREVWGSKSNFERNFVRKEKVPIRVKGGELKRVYQAVGYKNLELLRRKFSPMSIRITYDDIVDDVAIPSLVTEQIHLDMSPKQSKRYEELQSGIRTIRDDKNMPTTQKAVTALTAFTIGSQICAGTFALKTTSQNYEPDGPEASPKLDWIMDKLGDDWKEEKVVIYAKFRGSIMALQNRLSEHGIGYSTVWGVETDADIRKAEMDRFWEDPETRVMIISVSGERSLNLQNASILVMWDLQLNPARVAQIAGRVRRVGSTHKRVFVFELLMNNTQEERYMAALSSRQALFDFVYDVDDDDEDSDTLLIQKLDPEEILKLIQP